MIEWKPYLYVDERNKEAQRFAKALPNYKLKDANIIVVLGGDGTMLRAIREHLDKNLPFYGMNFGHVGFLLNDRKEDLFFLPTLPELSVKSYVLSPLMVEYSPYGANETFNDIAINDVWVERGSAQSSWINLSVMDSPAYLSHYEGGIPKLIGDGVLVCTPQGSTAYARAMGGVPLPVNADVLQIVGSNISSPQWRRAIVSYDKTVELTNEADDHKKRPLKLFVDGIELTDDVMSVTIFRSDKTFTLMFDADRSLTEKIAKVQFGQIIV